MTEKSERNMMAATELNTSSDNQLDAYGGFIDVVGTKTGFFHVGKSTTGGGL